MTKTFDECREEQRKYDNDVFYDVWRSGGNPDAIDFDRTRDAYYDGILAEDCASRIVREQNQKTRTECGDEDDGEEND